MDTVRVGDISSSSSTPSWLGVKHQVTYSSTPLWPLIPCFSLIFVCVSSKQSKACIWLRALHKIAAGWGAGSGGGLVGTRNWISNQFHNPLSGEYNKQPCRPSPHAPPHPLTPPPFPQSLVLLWPGRTREEGWNFHSDSPNKPNNWPDAGMVQAVPRPNQWLSPQSADNATLFRGK